MFASMVIVVTLCALLFQSANAATPALGSYNINPDTITVSGLSSGAYMAVQVMVLLFDENLELIFTLIFLTTIQMHVAYSKNVVGAAIFAGVFAYFQLLPTYVVFHCTCHLGTV